MYYVYLLLSERNGKTYIGFTSKDPRIRLQEHNNGSNSFTKMNKPWSLMYYETFTCKNCAQMREKFLKTGVGKRLRKIIIENY